MVQTLVVIAGLLTLMATLAANQRAMLNRTQTQLRTRRAEVAARSAVALALATLQEADPNVVTLNDEWAILGENGSQVFELDGASYRLQIVDCGSRINVNTATEFQLQTLPITPEQRDSLLDWREAAIQGRPEGAKDEFYNGLAQPYNARLGRLSTLSELLLIRGWTAIGLYSPVTEVVSTTGTLPEDAAGNPLALIDLLTVESGMPNTRPDGAARVNISQGNVDAGALAQLGIAPNLAETIAEGAPYSSFEQLLSLPGVSTQAAQQLLDDVTVTPSNRLEGKVNINTAPQAVLESIGNLPPDIAAAILSRQATGFLSLGELATIPGVTGLALAQIADSVGIGSDTWLVRAYGESGGVGVAVEVTIGIRDGEVQIVNFDRLPDPGVPEWWNWETDATTAAVSAAEAGPTADAGAAQ